MVNVDIKKKLYFITKEDGLRTFYCDKSWFKYSHPKIWGKNCYILKDVEGVSFILPIKLFTIYDKYNDLGTIIEDENDFIVKISFDLHTTETKVALEKMKSDLNRASRYFFLFFNIKKYKASIMDKMRKKAS